MSKKIIILGGGVAGMSAAHELSERGFEVEVFEKREQIAGGKARSVPVWGTGTENRKDLPGEHGFRFFPGFYKHVTDTMKRIPFKNNKNGVFDNLVNTNTVMMARFSQSPIVLPDSFPRSLEDIELIFRAIFETQTGLTSKDISFFARRVWQLMTSSKERRLAEYESVGWWQYLQADSHSEAYRNLFVLGLTRSLVAAKAEEASTRTVGDIFLQLLYTMLDPNVATDRVLNGPTNEVWIDPWLAFLTTKRGVKYHFGHETVKIHTSGNKISGFDIKLKDGTVKTIIENEAYYISAMPVERMYPLMSSELNRLDPSLYTLKELAKDVNWMNGIQYYLSELTPINKGHVIYTDSPWALTSISQKQFWKNIPLDKYGDGKVKDVLSVDISDWFTPGLNGKKAVDCTKEEVKEEVWQQLKKSLNVNGLLVLKDENVLHWHLDSDIIFYPYAPATNEEPLLINKVNSWTLRPEAYTAIPNLFLAADYVRTFTDLATMEGANEAARRATNAILDAEKSSQPYCKIWNLYDPWFLAPLRWKDKKRFNKGLPWTPEMPFVAKIAIFFVKILVNIYSLFKKQTNKLIK